jgi:hypothetical protein
LRIESSTLARIALATMMVLAAAAIWHETRGTTLWYDEWTWALQRRGGGIDTLLEPHYQHFSLVPLLIYKGLFAATGIADYAPYRAMIVVAHLLCTSLLFVYASRRIGAVAALVPAALLLTLGPGWQDILWPFQVAWLISLAAGLGALLALDRGDRRGDLAACALLVLSLASCGLGIPIAAGLLVEVLWGRRNWRDAWIVAAPLAVYGVWWIAYQETDFWRHNIVIAPRFAINAAGGALAALAGVSEQHYDTNGALMAGGAGVAWGRPLAVAGTIALVWRLAVVRPVPTRMLTLLAMMTAFWLLTGLQRSQISAPDASRYVYVGALFVLLLIVEIARGLPQRAGRGAAALIACATALVIVANLGDLRAGARFLRDQAQVARADLGALDLARASVPPGYSATHFPGVPLVTMDAAQYFTAARDYGSPAFTAPEIAAAPEDARQAADGELVAIHRIALRPGAAKAGTAPPPVDAVTGGTVRAEGGCLRFRPDAARSAATAAELQVTVPAGGIELSAEGGPATVAMRRFSVTFPPGPLAQLAAGGSGVLRPGADRAGQLWHVSLKPAGDAGACALRAGA